MMEEKHKNSILLKLGQMHAATYMANGENKELRTYVILLRVSPRKRKWPYNYPLFLLKRFYQQYPALFCPAGSRNEQR